MIGTTILRARILALLAVATLALSACGVNNVPRYDESAKVA